MNLDISSVEDVKKYLAQGGDPNERDWRGHSLLHDAAKYGYIESMKALIEAGADVNAKQWEGRTVLELAITGDQPEAIKLLAAGGADINNIQDLHHADGYETTPLIQSVYWNSEASVQALIESGVDLDGKVTFGDGPEKTALSVALSRVEEEVWDDEFVHNPSAENMACMLIKAGASLNEGSTLSYLDDLSSNQAIMEALVERQAKEDRERMLEAVQPHIQAREAQQLEQANVSRQRRKM